ncbi:hypothetical protein TRFO_10671 [Tritrichomonas foetus]|uniref:Uncharacterized protein n=1 Tax=Tritrichomonas foetus TaxID=1144522 RepID=A0A1J4JBZ8_9EUKA|nr:hypothetical protein TRFO_10671 [Tritrichomonas foetus]|eukprot:OHS95179.1 hypothetical protein TRFO_10671 [Tritrichomonas foetus]
MSSSSENFNFSESSSTEINSDVEELQMLQKLRLNENEIFDKEKEMQNRIMQYERKIKELQDELNSRGSSENTQNNENDNQKSSNENSFSPASYNSEKMEHFYDQYSQYTNPQTYKFLETPSMKHNNQLNTQPTIQTNYSHCNSSIKQINTNNCYSNVGIRKEYKQVETVTSPCRIYSRNEETKVYDNNKYIKFINELEFYVNDRLIAADYIVDSIYDDNCSYVSYPTNQSLTKVQDLQQQNLKLKKQINDLTASINRYFDRHSVAKQKRMMKENQYKQRIQTLETNHQNLLQFITNELQQFINPGELINDESIKRLIMLVSAKLRS